jgi:hypothetical protein
MHTCTCAKLECPLTFISSGPVQPALRFGMSGGITENHRSVGAPVLQWRELSWIKFIPV